MPDLVVGRDGWERIYDPYDGRKIVYYNLPGEPRYTISLDSFGWCVKRHFGIEHTVLAFVQSLPEAKKFVKAQAALLEHEVER